MSKGFAALGAAPLVRTAYPGSGDRERLARAEAAQDFRRRYGAQPNARPAELRGPTAQSTSLLPARAAQVARALFANPDLRSLPQDELARRLGVPEAAARCAVAAIVGALDRVGRGSVSLPALVPHLSLERAVGRLSLDQAMARFASHVGPEVQSPGPRHAFDGRGAYDAGFDEPTDVPPTRGGNESPDPGPTVIHDGPGPGYGPDPSTTVVHDPVAPAPAPSQDPPFIPPPPPPPYVPPGVVPASHTTSDENDGAATALLFLGVGAAALFFLTRKGKK